MLILSRWSTYLSLGGGGGGGGMARLSITHSCTCFSQYIRELYLKYILSVYLVRALVSIYHVYRAEVPVRNVKIGDREKHKFLTPVTRRDSVLCGASMTDR